jgi:hypothetical protein
MAGLSTWGEVLCMKEHRVEEGNSIHERTIFLQIELENLLNFHLSSKHTIFTCIFNRTCNSYIQF